jgi:Phage tail tube protein
MSQIAFPLTHAGVGLNPLCYIQEVTFGTKITASPSYTAVPITGDLTPTIDGVSIDVRQMGNHDVYGIQNAGINYGFTAAINPLNTTFIKIGTELPNYTTPAGTSAASYQFLIGYKQATGTVGMGDYYLFLLGCKPDTTTITVSAQSLVEASMTWGVRQIPKPILAPGGLTTPTIPTFASITGPVFQDSDGGVKPLLYNAISYAVNNFTITWNNHLIRDGFNGSGLVDALTVGGREITGSFTTPVGQDLLMETAMESLTQAGVTMKYTVKAGVFVITMNNVLLQTDSNPFEGSPTNTMKHTYTFKCASASIGTS